MGSILLLKKFQLSTSGDPENIFLLKTGENKFQAPYAAPGAYNVKI